MFKSLPIGRDNFKDIIEGYFYYVDKTDIIEEIFKNKNYVSLFPRPRRFGKSLFISMLDNFFNIEYKDTNKNLFDNLKINKSEYYKELSTRPVIKLDFKSLKQDNYQKMYNSFKEMIRETFSKKKYLLNILDEYETEIFNSFLGETATEDKYQKSIYLLSNFMYRYYNKKVIILIDEYDVPVQQGYLKHFYEDIVSFMREVFSSALKGNNNIEFAIMTGVLRVSKESLFSDLNNVKIYSIMDEKYNECFGFNTHETKELLSYYGLELNDDVKRMYDGYNFSGIEIYNPWSILNYADDKKLNPYWVNTSGNELIINSIKNCDENIKIVIEKLLSGESVEFIYNDKITYLDYNDLKSLNNILNLLFVSGYLTIDKVVHNDFGDDKIFVKLPNKEVRHLFRNIIFEIITTNYRIDNKVIEDFCKGVLYSDKELMQNALNKILPNISYMDNSESFYHGYLLGLFSMFLNNKRFIVRSNRESGIGRFDVMIKDIDRNIGMIIELKITDGDIEKEAISGLNQIKNKKYYQDLVSDGYKEIYKYAICFKNKECVVK